MIKSKNKKFNKNIGKILIVAIVFVATFFTVQNTNKISSNAASTYNKSAALSYASGHWNKNAYSIQCAEFVSNCLSSGGISVKQTTCQGLRNSLVSKGYGSEYKLTSTTVGKYKKVKISSNSGKLSAGDVMLWRCTRPSCMKSKSGWKHAVLYSGVNKNGYVCAYAHNGPHNKGDVMCASCHSCGSSSCMSIYAIHLNKSSYTTSSSSKNSSTKKKNTSLKSFKSTFTVKTSSKTMYSSPYISSTAKGKLKNGDKVTVVGYLYNKNGNLWYKTNKGYYVSCSYLAASSSKAPSNYINKTYILTAKTKSLVDIPSCKGNGVYTSKITRTLKKGQTVKIVGRLTNAFGNTWYMTSSGDYIWSGGLKAVN